ncbi:trans-aconitate methyltransferase [Actinopolyspora lacussalsi]|nr:trans-aconitate methyltransferase [Actinopolyspora lacussalsi]
MPVVPGRRQRAVSATRSRSSIGSLSEPARAAWEDIIDGQHPESDIGDDPDLSRPNLARMYDYFLGGSVNFEIDRRVADQAAERAPASVTFAVENRAFLRRVVRYLLDAGIDQFLDLGSGVPTAGNVHEIAHERAPWARVAYVDHEPVAVAHARRLLRDSPNVTITRADARDTATVLHAPGIAGLLDFDRPVAVLAVALLHAIPDHDDPGAMLAAYRDACCTGSAVAVSHLSGTAFTSDEQQAVRELLEATPTPVTFRDQDEIGRLLTGYRLADPGLVLLPEWRSNDESPPRRPAAHANGYAAVGWC